MKTPTVEFPRSLADEFKIYAKTAFPREEYAILLGTATKSGVYRPEALYFPPDTHLFSTAEWVDPQDSWWREARKEARRLNLSILGDLHSHCYLPDWVPDKTAGPSAPDLVRGSYLRRKTRRARPIFGICSVYPSDRGHEAIFRFWAATVQPETYLVDL